ncbi:conserved hypothetical protein [Pseudomonas sp. IT-P100]
MAAGLIAALRVFVVRELLLPRGCVAALKPEPPTYQEKQISLHCDCFAVGREQVLSPQKPVPPRPSSRLMTQRKPSLADWGKLAAEILPGGQHDYPTSLLAD